MFCITKLDCWKISRKHHKMLVKKKKHRHGFRQSCFPLNHLSLRPLHWMIAFSSIRSLQDSHHPADCGMHASDWGRGGISESLYSLGWIMLDSKSQQLMVVHGSAAGHHTHHHGARSSRGDSYLRVVGDAAISGKYLQHTHTRTHITYIYIYLLHHTRTYYTIRKSS